MELVATGPGARPLASQSLLQSTTDLSPDHLYFIRFTELILIEILARKCPPGSSVALCRQVPAG